MHNLQKAKKELALLVISLILLLGFVCIGFFRFMPDEFEEETAPPEETQINNVSKQYDFSDKYYYNQLSPSMQKEFAKIYDGIENYQTTIVLDNVSVDDLNRIIYILYFDCPEFFYLSDSAQNYNHIKNTATVFYPQYMYTPETIDKMKEEIGERCSSIPLKSTPMTALELEKYIHDFLISNISYSKDTENCMNIYGALIEGKANCKGYSSAFTYLTRKAGLRSLQVIGYASENTAAVGHSWNAVKIGNSYYYVDVCWDDFDGSDKYGGLSGSYIFFNIPANKMALSHNPTETIKTLGNPPVDNDDSLIYYKSLGFYAADPQSAQRIIRNGIKRVHQSETNYVILQCDTQDVYNAVIVNIQSIIKDEIENNDYRFSGCDFIDISNSNTIILTNFAGD